jgi:hypothetical protein
MIRVHHTGQQLPVLFRCHAGLGQRAARGRKADHDLEPLSGADQIAHTDTGAQRILDFGECRASILVPRPRDHGGDGLGITGSVGKQKLVALSRIKHVSGAARRCQSTGRPSADRRGSNCNRRPTRFNGQPSTRFP